MKRLISLCLVLFFVGCDQGININIESEPEEQFYCSPSPLVSTEESERLEIFRIHDECKPGDSLLFNYFESSVNYDNASDYDYRPTAVINQVCDHSKEIVVHVVADTMESYGLNATGYKSWDISCIYSGRKTYRSPYAD